MPLTPKGIPEALSFDRVINGGCCPPLTKREFLSFLKYHEHSAENLQFFLWYKDYEKRFAAMPESEQALAPVWTDAQIEAQRKAYVLRKKSVVDDAVAKEMFQGTDFEEVPKIIDPESVVDAGDSSTGSAPGSSGAGSKRDTVTSEGPARPMSNSNSVAVQSVVSGFSVKADSTFEDAGLQRPFKIQPYREEISRIIAVYISEDSSRCLNLSGRERHAVLKALEYTTHPSAFKEVANTVEYTLRRQAHPNFIRWAICNGNRPRVLFARGLGIFLIVGAIIAEVIITLSWAGRAWRVLPLILLILGISTLIAAWKGMCVVLHGLHHQHVRPWELFAEDDEAAAGKSGGSGDGGYSTRYGLSMESLTSNSSNSFEDEPWVRKYSRRNLVRKIFDRETWIEEPALRQIQDTIFVQSLIAATIIGAVVVGIFVALPHGRMI